MFAYRKVHSADRYFFRCQNADGGFGGGPGQLSHLAPTYAASNALALLDDREALEVVDRAALARWLKTLWRPDGRQEHILFPVSPPLKFSK